MKFQQAIKYIKESTNDYIEQIAPQVSVELLKINKQLRKKDLFDLLACQIAKDAIADIYRQLEAKDNTKKIRPEVKFTQDLDIFNNDQVFSLQPEINNTKQQEIATLKQAVNVVLRQLDTAVDAFSAMVTSEPDLETNANEAEKAHQNLQAIQNAQTLDPAAQIKKIAAIVPNHSNVYSKNEAITLKPSTIKNYMQPKLLRKKINEAEEKAKEYQSKKHHRAIKQKEIDGLFDMLEDFAGKLAAVGIYISLDLNAKIADFAANARIQSTTVISA